MDSTHVFIDFYGARLLQLYLFLQIYILPGSLHSHTFQCQARQICYLHLLILNLKCVLLDLNQVSDLVAKTQNLVTVLVNVAQKSLDLLAVCFGFSLRRSC